LADIETITGSTEVTIEMGATWFGKQHPTLTALLDELGIPYFNNIKGYFTI
jgi:monoamine oxidase